MNITCDSDCFQLNSHRFHKSKVGVSDESEHVKLKSAAKLANIILIYVQIIPTAVSELQFLKKKIFFSP